MILLVNGPNLNLLGEREPGIYGSVTLAEVEEMVRQACAPYGLQVVAFQSNHEGELLDFLHHRRLEARGVILNPGALGHTSHALHDAVKALACPVVEVHVSNVHAREEWRRADVVAPATRGQVVGLGTAGYWLAALWLCSEVGEPSGAGRGEEEPAEPGGPQAGGAPAGGRRE